jgi:uncharacterized protein YbjQ (UPF0145 family)
VTVPPAVGERAPWSANLSVAEFAAVGAVGFSPVGFVIGASVYRFGTQVAGRYLAYKPSYGLTGSKKVASFGWMPGRASVRAPKAWTGGYQETYPCRHGPGGHVPGFNYEDATFTNSIADAYDLARDRLRQDAARLGAQGVVGVRTEIRPPTLLGSAAPATEIRLTGTAVRAQGTGDLATPFTSHLSGQAFAKLLLSGWIPADMVIGLGAVRSFFGCVGDISDPRGKMEFTQRSDAMQICRELAIERLAAEATHDKMKIVGATTVGPFGSHHTVDTLFAHALVGTAAIRFRTTALPSPRITLTLGTT